MIIFSWIKYAFSSFTTSRFFHRNWFCSNQIHAKYLFEKKFKLSTYYKFKEMINHEKLAITTKQRFFFHTSGDSIFSIDFFSEDLNKSPKRAQYIYVRMYIAHIYECDKEIIISFYILSATTFILKIINLLSRIS